MQNILAVDTSSRIASLAIKANDKVLTLDIDQLNMQAECILPGIESLLAQVNLDIKQINKLLYGCGPGGFTGLRIGGAVVQALADSINCSIVNVSSLQLIAQEYFIEFGCKEIIACVDARMQEFYWGHYKLDSKNNIMKLQGVEQVTDLLTMKRYTKIIISNLEKKLLPKAKYLFFFENLIKSSSRALPSYVRDKVVN